jgi:hypothetical protein
MYTSNIITVTWINTSTWITSTNGTLMINWVESGNSWTVYSWSTVSIKLTSSSSYSSSVSSTVTIWWISSTYTITTKSQTISSWGWWGSSSSIATCLDTQLTCYNGIYIINPWINCNSWNLWKICNIVTSSTGQTNENSWSIINSNQEQWNENSWSLINSNQEQWNENSNIEPNNNNLQELVDKINKDPTLNKTYNIQKNNTWSNSSNDREKVNVYFKDIKNNFAKQYIEKLASKWIVTWYKDNTFNPQQPITRAEYLKIVLRANNIDYSKVDTKILYFTDVDKNSWQAKVVTKATELWIISKNNKKFRPNDNISRAEAMKILIKWSNIKVQEIKNSSFWDVSGVFTKYIETAKNLWIISANTHFRPTNNISRAEVAKIIIKIIELNDNTSLK